MPAARPDRRATTAALSLLELQRELLRRAGALRARARGRLRRGDSVTAFRLSEQSSRLRTVAQTMNIEGIPPRRRR